MTVHEPRTTSRPALRPELERCRVGDLEVLTLDGSLHLGVDLADATVLRELDGTSSIAALTARHGEAAAELIDELAEAGFLVGSPPFVAPSFEVSSLGVEFGGFDQLVARTDRLVGPILAATWFRLAALALLAAGPVAFVTQHRGPGLSGSTTLAVLVVWELVAIAAHEMAHGLVLHRGGRRVGRAGLGLHWGAITFFVDATDAFFLPRRRRVAQALA